MINSRIVPALVRALSTIVLLTAPMTHLAAAQDRPGPTLELTAGFVGFPDDGIVNEGLIGGSGRFYLLPRVSVGPEIGYMHGENHSHLMLTGNVTWDLLSPNAGRPRSATPFVVVGAGLFQTRESFFNGPFTSTEGAFTAGGGVRASVGDRTSIGVDARIGWELHVRVNALVSLQLGR